MSIYDNHAFGKQIKLLMEQKGLNYGSLSRKTGIAKSTLFKWVNEETPHSLKNVYVLSKVFGVTTDKLIANKTDLKAESLRRC